MSTIGPTGWDDGPAVEVSGDGDLVVVTLRGEHDLATAESVADALRRAAAVPAAAVVVDLGEVTFMDASTVNAVLAEYGALHAQARPFSLLAPSAWAQFVLALCGLTGLVEAASDGIGQPSEKPGPRANAP